VLLTHSTHPSPAPPPCIDSLSSPRPIYCNIAGAKPLRSSSFFLHHHTYTQGAIEGHAKPCPPTPHPLPPLLFTALLVRCCRCCLPLSSSDNKQMKKKEIKEGNDFVYLYKSGRERRRRRWKHLKQTKKRIQHAKIQPKNKRAPPGLAIGLTAFINSSFTTSVLCLCNSPLYLLTFKEPSMFHTLPPSIPPSLPSSLPPSPHRPPLHPLRNSKRSRQARALDPHTIDDALHPSLPPSLPPSLGKRRGATFQDEVLGCLVVWALRRGGTKGRRDGGTEGGVREEGR